MSDSIDPQLLDYYQRELTWLNRAGVDFIENYPLLAAGLKLSPSGSQDPHVERLLESFALLAARLQRRLDDGYSEFSDALLEQLYPMAMRPMPSCVIAQFVPDKPKLELSDGHLIERGLSVFKAPDKDQPDSIYFRTSASVKLWPVEVEAVTFLGSDAPQQTNVPQAVSALKLTLKCSGKKTWAKLGITTLRIHLAGAPNNSALLYDLLAAHSLAIVCALPGGIKRPLQRKPVPVGFSDQERLLPEEDGVHPALRLLVEYFAFPEKFAFFDIPLDIPAQATDMLELYIAFDRLPDNHITLQREDVALGCVPLINLFPRTSETIRPDGTRTEHRLSADTYRDNSIEIHSITRLSASSPDKTVSVVPAYYASQHEQGTGGLFWHARRISGLKPGRLGTDLMLSLVDTHFQPCMDMPGNAFTAQVLCTNRHQAQNLAAHTRLKFESSGPVEKILLLNPPTRQSIPDLDGTSRWRLVSQLNLNHMSLVEGPAALSALKEMLILHNLRDDAAAQLQIDGISDLNTERVVDHVGEDAWRGWRKGLEVQLTLDANCFAGSSRVLFSGVLAHFFALYANTNCFVRTVLKDDNKVIKQWQPSSKPDLIL